LRSILGTAPGATEVRIEQLGRTAATDPAGNFVFRSMPAGTFTLSAREGERTVSQIVTLPAEPARLQNVVLRSETAVAALPAQVSAAPESEGEWRLQVGAFRVPENVAIAKHQLEGLGYRPAVSRAGGLQLVTIGPFASREAAEREAARLNALKIESVVVSEQLAPLPPVTGKGAFVIQVGAFRDASNAQQLIRRLARLGRRAWASVSGGLTLVRVGPFLSRTEATATSHQLQRTGFDALVTNR